jgi:hypothetical protein
MTPSRFGLTRILALARKCFQNDPDAMRVTRLVVLTLCLAARSLPAQEPRLIATDRPTVELTYEFTSITQVFELRDGRVVVLDRLEANVRLANLQAGTTHLIGAIGDGPGEYRGAASLIPLGGDSVGIVDAVNPRILALTSAGVPGGFVSPYSGHPLFAGRLSPRTADGRGWFYAERSVQRSNGQLSDSAAILRWRPGTEPAELVTTILRPPPPGAAVTSTGHVISRPGATPLLSPYTQWVAGSDGRMAIVNGIPYRVDLISPTGQRRAGTVIEYARTPVTEDIKEAYRRETSQPQMAYVLDRSTNTVTSTRMPAPRVTASNWAEELPAFRGDAVIVFAPDGVLWIQRTSFGLEGARYDLVAPDGNLIDRVRLPDGHRIIGFGRDAMYVVRRNEDDIEYLQRRPLPR